MKVHMNEEISKLYKQLGPFDYYSAMTNEEEEAEVKTLCDKFETRRSGA